MEPLAQKMQFLDFTITLSQSDALLPGHSQLRYETWCSCKIKIIIYIIAINGGKLSEIANEVPMKKSRMGFVKNSLLKEKTWLNRPSKKGFNHGTRGKPRVNCVHGPKTFDEGYCCWMGLWDYGTILYYYHSKFCFLRKISLQNHL